MIITLTSNPKDYEQFNIETNGFTQNTIFSISPLYSQDSNYLVSYRVINRKRYNISLEIKDIIALYNKINLITCFNDDDFILFADSPKDSMESNNSMDSNNLSIQDSEDTTNEI